MGGAPFSDPGVKPFLAISQATTNVQCWIKTAAGILMTVTQQNPSSATAVSFPQFGQQEYHQRQSEDLSEVIFVSLCVCVF